MENEKEAGADVRITGYSKWIWGSFMLLAAVFILSNQIGGFTAVGIGSIIASAFALAVMVQCLVSRTFAPLPIPIAAIYYIYQVPLGFPVLKVWVLILAAVLASVGLAVMLPSRGRYHWSSGRDSDAGMQTEEGGDANNPSVSVQFGSVSRYLHSDCLETVRLNSKFGSLEVFFDQVKLSPNGAELVCNCNFGSIEVFLPKQWRVIDKLNSTMGGIEHKSHRAAPAEDAPQLTITGSVSFGSVEIRYI